MSHYFVETTRDRISAVDFDGHELAGADFRRGHWVLYIDHIYLDAFGVTQDLSPVPMFTREQALSWLHLLVAGYFAKKGDAA